MLNLSTGVTAPPAGSASQVAIRRLQKDYAKLIQDPVDGIKALPNDENILEWHYCLRGSPDTPFEGGYYWGKVIFKENFPWSPPSIMMITPNGRFHTNTRLCLSISDYHPESWNPGWTVSAILIGLHSFMNENMPAAGAIPGTPQEKKNYAAASKEFNCKYREFRRFFPSFVEEWTGVVPSPDEPNVAPVMLPAHATPTGIAVPQLNQSRHSAHGVMGMMDPQLEQMLNVVRGGIPGPGAAGGGPAGAAYFAGPQPPYLPMMAAAAAAGAGAAVPPPPVAPAFYPMDPMQPYRAAAAAANNFYADYMGFEAPVPRLVPRRYNQPGYHQDDEDVIARAERLIRLGFNGPAPPAAAGRRENGGGAGGAAQNNGGGARGARGRPPPQNDPDSSDDEDGPTAPKRLREGDDVDHAITLD